MLKMIKAKQISHGFDHVHAQMEPIYNIDEVDILMAFWKWLHPSFWVIKIVRTVFVEKTRSE